jgi:hypothetical protein
MTTMDNKIEIGGVLYDTHFDRSKDYRFIIISDKREYFKFCDGCGKIQLYGLKTDLIRQINKKSKCLECRNYRGPNHPMYGRNHTKKSILKMSLCKIGNNPSSETREKIRKSALKRAKLYCGSARYNPRACKYFDKLNKENGWKLQHAENGGEIECAGYSIDAYDKDKNIVVEYDEPHHIKPSRKNKDQKRMNEIIDRLGCCFYRYDEKKNILNKIN